MALDSVLQSGWVVLVAAGLALLVVGAGWGAWRAAAVRSQVWVRVVGFSTAGAALVHSEDPARPDAWGTLDRPLVGLRQDDALAVRQPGADGGTYAPHPRPWAAYWLGALLYGGFLAIVGAAGLARGGHTLPLPAPIILAVFASWPFVLASKVVALVSIARHGSRVKGRIVEYRDHPHVTMGGSGRGRGTPASQALIEYDHAGHTRTAWSRAGYATSMFTGSTVTAWVDDRCPAEVMTLGTTLYVSSFIFLVGGIMGITGLVAPLLY